MITLKAPAPGPAVVITANVHGDEATGVGVVHELAQRLPRLLKAGMVHLYPSLNPEALIQRQRTVPADGQDLNRQWPGEERGSPAERQAHLIWQDILTRKPELLIDLHADAPASIPYAIVDRVVRRRKKGLDATCEALGQATGLTLLREFPADRYLEFRLDRSLSGAAVNVLGIPAVTIESGPRLYLDPASVGAAAAAVLGVLTHAGLVQRPAPEHPSRIAGGPWRRESGPRVSQAGVFHSRRGPGQRFIPGDLLAEVLSLEGRVVESVRAQGEGWIVSLPERAWVVPGVSVGTYAVQD